MKCLTRAELISRPEGLTRVSSGGSQLLQQPGCQHTRALLGEWAEQTALQHRPPTQGWAHPLERLGEGQCEDPEEGFRLQESISRSRGCSPTSGK